MSWKHLSRDQQFKALAITDQIVIGPCERRWAAFFSLSGPQSVNGAPKSSSINAVSTGTTGAKLSFTVPANCNYTLKTATFVSDAIGGQAMNLIINRVASGINYNIATYTTNGVWFGDVPLFPGDIVQWFCSTAIASSTADLTLNFVANPECYRATISFKGPAVLDQGFTIYPGQDPQLIMYDDVGESFKEEIHAIAPALGATLEIMQIIMDKPCWDRMHSQQEIDDASSVVNRSWGR
jgi:hypothetical protein